MFSADNPQFGQVADRRDLVVLLGGDSTTDHFFKRRGCGSNPNICGLVAGPHDVYCRMLNPSIPTDVVVVMPDGSTKVNQCVVSGEIYCDYEEEVLDIEVTFFDGLKSDI